MAESEDPVERILRNATPPPSRMEDLTMMTGLSSPPDSPPPHLRHPRPVTGDGDSGFEFDPCSSLGVINFNFILLHDIDTKQLRNLFLGP